MRTPSAAIARFASAVFARAAAEIAPLIAVLRSATFDALAEASLEIAVPRSVTSSVTLTPSAASADLAVLASEARLVVRVLLPEIRASISVLRLARRYGKQLSPIF